MAQLHRILVVDDSIFIQQIIKDALADSYELFFECSGEAALDFLNDYSVDAVILDVNMAGIDGYETYRRIRSSGRMHKILFLTSESREQVERHIPLNQTTTYLAKPFVPQRLKQYLGTLFRPTSP